MYQKWPDQIFPTVNFVFSHDGHFGLGRGGGGFGGGPPPWFLIILKKPWAGGESDAAPALCAGAGASTVGPADADAHAHSRAHAAQCARARAARGGVAATGGRVRCDGRGLRDCAASAAALGLQWPRALPEAEGRRGPQGLRWRSWGLRRRCGPSRWRFALRDRAARAAGHSMPEPRGTVEGRFAGPRAGLLRGISGLEVPLEGPGGGGGGWHKASVSDCVPLAAPIGLSPLLILTLCGPERVLVVSTEPPDDLSCLTTPGVGRPGDGAVARAVDPVHPDAHCESMRGFADSSTDLSALGCASAGSFS